MYRWSENSRFQLVCYGRRIISSRKKWHLPRCYYQYKKLCLECSITPPGLVAGSQTRGINATLDIFGIQFAKNCLQLFVKTVPWLTLRKGAARDVFAPLPGAVLKKFFDRTIGQLIERARTHAQNICKGCVDGISLF